MAISYDDAKSVLQELKPKHDKRQFELHALRRYWQGNYWDDQAGDRSGVSSVSQLFRDLKANQSDVGPDLKIVHNLLQEVCVKYQTFLAPVPQIRTFRDPPFSENRRRQSDLKERVLYGTWWMNQMARRMGEIGWYLPLMGDCFPGIWPDFDRKLVRIIIRSPEGAHPVRNSHTGRLDAIIFHRDEHLSALQRDYPGYQMPSTPSRVGRLGARISGRDPDRGEVLEWSDDNEYVLWVGGQEQRRVNHSFGFNLFGQMGFIPVPGEPYNHGAVEQTVSMVEMGNAGLSLMWQAMLENVFPTMVIKDPAKAPRDILRGPGSVIPVNPGGDVSYLTPPAQALGVQMAFLHENADRVLESASMPRVSLGQSPATSIVTGAAVNELQGAGSGSTIEMVQGTEIGPELSSVNEKVLFVYANEFKSESVEMYAIDRQSGMELSGRGNANAFTFKGSEIVGSYRNEIVFSPHYNDHEKLVMALQARGAGIVSKRYVGEQIGITDWDAMVEEILQEEVEAGVLGALVSAMSEPTPQAADQVEQKTAAFLEPLQPGPPHPLLSMGAQAAPPLPPSAGPSPLPAGPPPSAAPPGAPGTFPGGPGAVVAPPLALPQGAPPPAAGPAPPPAASSARPVELGQVRTDLLGVHGIHGRVFLIGEIVQRGQAAGPIDVAVTERADEQTISAALPQYQFDFKVIAGEPGEPSVEVTPGTNAATPAPAPEPVPAPVGG